MRGCDMQGLIVRLRELIERLVNSRGRKGTNLVETAGETLPADREEREVLRGTQRQVVVVRSPDPKVFEEAIFIVREDFLSRPDRGRRELMLEARRAADSYVTATLGKRPLRLNLPAALYAACAAVGAAVAWVVMRVLVVF